MHGVSTGTHTPPNLLGQNPCSDYDKSGLEMSHFAGRKMLADGYKAAYEQLMGISNQAIIELLPT
jgi:hypothetical protein